MSGGEFTDEELLPLVENILHASVGHGNTLEFLRQYLPTLLRPAFERAWQDGYDEGHEQGQRRGLGIG